jgi:Uma2 family endonuclease
MTIETVLPSLENGDHLDREEFHRRYSLRPDLHGVELIEGVVSMPSPINLEYHGRPSHLLDLWLGAYAATHPEVDCSTPTSVLLDGLNQVEPDLLMFHKASGLIRPDGYAEGAPELVVEIAASSVSRDLHEKLTLYERNGVREYIVWRVLEEAIDWFVLTDGRFVPQAQDARGLFESQVFPGLRLDVAAAIAGDRVALLAPLLDR